MSVVLNPLLAWTDEETTGLDLDDHILELAIVFTDSKLVERGRINTLIQPQPTTFARLAANPIVSRMHKSSGLTADLRKKGEQAPTVEEAEDAILDLIDQIVDPGQVVMMAGGGVSHFDISHLGHWMPRLRDRLYYGTIDLSDVSRGYVAATGNKGTFAKSSTKAHRALQDVLDELRIAPAIWDMFQQYDSSRYIPGHSATPSERVMAGASLIQAALHSDDDDLTMVLDGLSSRDAIVGATTVSTQLLRWLSKETGKAPLAILNEVRLRAAG